MKQKNLITAAIIILMAIVTVIIIAAFQTKFFSEAADPGKKTLTIMADTNIEPVSGPPGTEIVVNIKSAKRYPADYPIEIWLDKYDKDNNTFLTAFTSTQDSDSYVSNTTIPLNTSLGEHKINVYGKVKSDNTEYQIYYILGVANFNVTEAPVSLPSPTDITTTTTTPTPVDTTTTPTTTKTVTTTPTPTPTPTETTATTTPESTQTTTASIPTVTQTTSTAPSIIAPLPIITAPAPESTSEPAYSVPPVITTTPTPDITAVPIIIKDDDTPSTIETDKDEIVADGEDKVIIKVTLKDEQGQIISDPAPTIEITGNDNTVSEIQKHGDGQYSVTLTSTTPEEKTIRVSVGDNEFPELKIAAHDSGVDLEKKLKAQQFTPYYSSWWFWTLIILGIALVLVLSLSYRHKLHSEEI